MITEDDLRRTLRGHERLAPDAAPVAAHIAAGVRARRRHRYTGTAAVAIATAVAVGVPTLVLRDADRTGRTGTVGRGWWDDGRVNSLAALQGRLGYGVPGQVVPAPHRGWPACSWT